MTLVDSCAVPVPETGATAREGVPTSACVEAQLDLGRARTVHQADDDQRFAARVVGDRRRHGGRHTGRAGRLRGPRLRDEVAHWPAQPRARGWVETRNRQTWRVSKAGGVLCLNVARLQGQRRAEGKHDDHVQFHRVTTERTSRTG